MASAGVKKYGTLYERLVANTVLAEPDNPQSCWLWTGHIDVRGYPRISMRVGPRPQPPKLRRAHRLMLEEVLDAEFPVDEAGHLCYETRCINPMHLEVQTRLFNLSDRRGHRQLDGCMIPTLFPRHEELDAAIARAWDEPFRPYHGPCPF